MAMNFLDPQGKDILQQFNTQIDGLSFEEAKERLKRLGPNRLHSHKKFSSIGLLLKQFVNPLILLLIGAATLSLFLHQGVDAWIILTIVVVSGVLGFLQEGRALYAIEKLLKVVHVTASVKREGVVKEVPVEEVVIGDIVFLSAGDLIPADMVLLSSKDLFVDESPLTGEAFAVEKNEAKNTLFMGCHVISGSGEGVVAKVGKQTEFGKIAKSLKARKGKTAFEEEVARFGLFLMKVTFGILVSVLGLNVLLQGARLNALLFALAIAVGLTPQLLPAIVSLNLARGARKMARLSVIVKRLIAIENFGNMTTLCVDKTGTITEGVVTVDAFIDIDGKINKKILEYAYVNAQFQTGYINPIDHAIQMKNIDIKGYTKLDEIPYDFSRKRLSVLVEHLLICKGALESIFTLCKDLEHASGNKINLDYEKIQETFQRLSSQGYRVLGVAYKEIRKTSVSKEDECEMTFLGFLVLGDHLKKRIKEMIAHLQEMKVSLRILTGDNVHVARFVAESLGLKTAVMTGKELSEKQDEDLKTMIKKIEIFAEVEPLQKERIVRLLQKEGEIVGFLGDGINDIVAMQKADVSISVNKAIDSAKEEADIVLLHKDLSVLIQGVKEGRKIFANTLKYIFMATSANFGNMFSMAGASLFLPFLPLLPKQILMNNLLTDIPEMTIGTDEVDRELIESPTSLNIAFISRFMWVFGCISSLFDYMTFFLLYLLDASKEEFWTGWFIESVVSAACIVLLIRTRRPFYKSRPSIPLILSTVFVVLVTLCLPITPIAPLMSFVKLPLSFYGAVLGILLLYGFSVEVAKKIFFGKA